MTNKITKQEYIEILQEARKEANENNFFIADEDGDGVCSLNVKYDEIIELAKQLDEPQREECEIDEDCRCSICQNYFSAANEIYDNFCGGCGAKIKKE